MKPILSLSTLLLVLILKSTVVFGSAEDCVSLDSNLNFSDYAKARLNADQIYPADIWLTNSLDRKEIETVWSAQNFPFKECYTCNFTRVSFVLDNKTYTCNYAEKAIGAEGKSIMLSGCADLEGAKIFNGLFLETDNFVPKLDQNFQTVLPKCS
ncbi:MAG: hypothetical protein AB8E15_13560 [Bdellovibrionales bacterium]